MGDNPILTTGGLSNFMEILPDGSFRCRIIICSEDDSSIANISSITMIHSIFKEIYEIVFGNNFVSNFIEAKKYEKLMVLKLFQPKIVVTGESKYVEKFNKLFNDHIIKCGSSFTLRKVKNYEYYHCTSYVRNGSCTSHSIRKDKLTEIVLDELNKKLKRNKIDTLTRDILLKNVDSIIIFQNGEINVKFK